MIVSFWALVLAVPGMLFALRDWRKGIFAMVVVGFLQDPLRKLDADRPVYFTILVGAVFAVAYLRAQTGVRFRPREIPGWTRYLGQPLKIALFLLVIQGLRSVILYGNPMIAGIGALSYLAPFPALLAGYYFAVKGGRASIEAWLTWYLVIAAVILVTIVMEYAGFNWDVLGDVGEGFVLYQDDAMLIAYSGFFRAPEIAAWHSATAICVLMLLSSLRRISSLRTTAVVLVIVAMVAIGMLTGRRKVLVEIIIFMTVFFALLAFFRKGGSKLAIAAVVGGLLSYAVISWWAAGESPVTIETTGAAFQYYAQRGASVGTDVTERFSSYGLEAVGWAIDWYGWLGGGLGVASQGAQYFGGGGDVFGGAGEGGLGKITAELGVPGLLIALWLAVAVVRYGWRVLRFDARLSTPTSRLACGLVALLIANLAVFSVATQVFGDLFVLLFLGLVAGFFLATPVLAERDYAKRAEPARAGPSQPSRAPVPVPLRSMRP